LPLTQSVCASARLSVTDKLQIDSSFLFLDGIEPFFDRKFSMTPSTKRCSSIFDLDPITPKIYSPEFGLKSPITRLVWQIDRGCLHLPGGFRVWPIQWNHAKCCGTDPCCHGNAVWPIAQRSSRLPAYYCYLRPPALNYQTKILQYIIHNKKAQLTKWLGVTAVRVYEDPSLR